jgi:acyl-coenzyme A thioesterase PaaI-like protein
MIKTESLQQKYAAKSICYGCGPANPDGLHINSFPEGDGLTCVWEPEPKFQAFPGMLYGGLIASLLDCHCNWTASWHLKNQNGLDAPPCTVTAELNVKYLAPTPATAPIRIISKVVKSKERSATVEGELYSGDLLCATCSAVFVAVKEGHPAYHRW